jgi:hypothetical protein
MTGPMVGLSCVNKRLSKTLSPAFFTRSEWRAAFPAAHARNQVNVLIAIFIH